MVEKIDIPDSVEGLGVEAFGDCAELKEIRFGKKIEHIRIDYFRTYYSDIFISQRTLKKLVISGATEIDDRTFESFHALESVVLGGSLIRIGERAFSNCSSLQNLDIPNSVVEIGFLAFSGCRNVKTIKWGTGLKCINEWSFAHCGITDIVIPDNIQEIKYGAFFDCGNLKNIHLGKSLIRIGGSAFSNTRIENIEIPKNVKEISSYAFGDCFYLTQVRILNTKAKIGECAFEKCRSLSKDCEADLIERFGPYLFQLSTESKIKNLFSEILDALTGGVPYKHPLFP